MVAGLYEDLRWYMVEVEETIIRGELTVLKERKGKDGWRLLLRPRPTTNTAISRDCGNICSNSTEELQQPSLPLPSFCTLILL